MTERETAELPAQIDSVVIGAGQAGLSMSWALTQAGRPHVVLGARDRLGGGWLRRWDSRSRRTLYTQTSSLLVGVGADAEYLAEHLAART
ncbi:MAG TPA: NAD(P)-binding protein [Candidatus Limnocylindria bacterium]|nr:NAD(P)-binding protein [Candidatus Limnocylindria bacterium]